MDFHQKHKTFVENNWLDPFETLINQTKNNAKKY